MFAFDEDIAWSTKRDGPAPPSVQLDKGWPCLGGKPASALKPASGLRGSLQTPRVSTPVVGGNLSGSAPGGASSASGALGGIPGSRGRPTVGAAKGGLAMLLANSRSSSRAPSEAGDVALERAAASEAAAKASPAAPRGRKKKSSNKKKGAKRGGGGSGANISTANLEKPDFLMPRALKASPSTSSLREEFKISADEEPEYTWSFVKRGPAAVAAAAVGVATSNSASSPPRSSLSSLLNQAHPGDIVALDGSDTPASSENGESEEALVAYEVALEEDYIARDVDSKPASRTASPSRRKVTADDFEPLKCLGKGAYGTVLLVRHKASGRLYAQKQLKKASIVVQKRRVEQTQTERAILESVRHPNVVKLFYAFQDHEKLYLILEYAQGGELFHHLAGTRMFCEDAVAFYIGQLVLALSHLHLNVGVVYRDLKPENCLLDAQGHLLLTDFGLSKVSSEYSRCSSLLGTAGYMAPEVLADDGAEYGAEVDWWGVGILAFELLTGKLPFEGSTPVKVKAKIQKQKLQMPSYLSQDAKDFITRLLRKEPHKRLGYNLAKDLPAIKAHRFFRKVNWAALERRELKPPIEPLVTDPLLAENFSTEFTSLNLSPAVGHAFPFGWGGDREEEEAFHGFSFVATSLLEEQFREDGVCFAY